MEPLTPPPSSFLVQTDIGGLRYQATSWAQLGWRLLAGYLLVNAVVLVVVVVLLAFMTASTSAPITTMLSICFSVLCSAGAFLLLLTMFLAWALYPRFIVDVTIDGFGVSIEERRGRRRLLWGDCSEVKRQGRRLDVLSRGRWQPLPAPRGIEDARWLESLIQSHIDARGGGESAPPATVTAALEALLQRQ